MYKNFNVILKVLGFLYKFYSIVHTPTYRIRQTRPESNRAADLSSVLQERRPRRYARAHPSAAERRRSRPKTRRLRARGTRAGSGERERARSGERECARSGERAGRGERECARSGERGAGGEGRAGENC